MLFSDNLIYYALAERLSRIIEHIQAEEKVFEIFHRLNAEGEVAGEGLGLSAVWRMLSRLDGTILVESESGKGSRFLVTLPNSK